MFLAILYQCQAVMVGHFMGVLAAEANSDSEWKGCPFSLLLGHWLAKSIFFP